MSGDLRARIRARDLVAGSMVQEFAVPALPAIAAAAGAEFLLYDMEHTAFTEAQVGAAVASARGLPLEILVRVPRVDYPTMSRLLDVGCAGVMLPTVETREQAENAVRSLKYAPEGARGTAFGIAHDGYLPGDVTEKIALANARSVIIAQIETPLGVANADLIASVPGIDALWVGHNDLTTSMGIPGRFGDDDYLAALDRVTSACSASGIAAGFRPDSPEHAVEMLARGFTLLACQTDVSLYRTGLARSIETVRDRFTTITPSQEEQ